MERVGRNHDRDDAGFSEPRATPGRSSAAARHYGGTPKPPGDSGGHVVQRRADEHDSGSLDDHTAMALGTHESVSAGDTSSTPSKEVVTRLTIKRLARAEKWMRQLTGIATTIETMAANPKTATAQVIAEARRLLFPRQNVERAIKLATEGYQEYVRAQISAGRNANAARREVNHPRMRWYIQELSKHQGQYMVTVEALAKKYPAHRYLFLSSSGAMASWLRPLRTYLGMKRMNAADYRAGGQLVVKTVSIDLGTGRPRDRIQEAVFKISLSWERRLANFGRAVNRFITIIESGSFEQASSGLVDFIVESAAKLVEKGSEAMGATAYVGKVMFGLIKQIRSASTALKVAHARGKATSFVSSLTAKLADLEKAGPSKQNAVTMNMIGTLDSEFIALGKTAGADQWKPGERGVVGPQAKFLKSLDDMATRYADNTPAQRDFTAQFLADWVVMNQGYKYRRGLGGFPGLRSPFSSPKEWTGTIRVDFELALDGTGRWRVAPSGAPTLVCPNSAKVAQGLLDSVQPFNLANVACGMHLRWKKHGKSHSARLDHSHQLIDRSGSDYWTLLSDTRLTIDQILAGFTTLRG